MRARSKMKLTFRVLAAQGSWKGKGGAHRLWIKLHTPSELRAG